VLYERVISRPKVDELSFHVFARWLHPELFEVVATRQVERGGYLGRIQITTSGHLITWQYQNVVLTEVLCPFEQPLPQRGRLNLFPVRGGRSESITLGPSICYQFSFYVEPVRSEVLQAFQEELLAAAEYQGLICQFDQPSRGCLPALSYAHVVTRNHSMLVQAFHTFPEEWAIVKVESTFRILPSVGGNGNGAGGGM
jgi:hypothetical protein